MIKIDDQSVSAWRYETKFNLTQDDELYLLEWIANTPDFNRAYATRRVNSVYFDDADYDCATTNLSGFGHRSKYRIRWYGDEVLPKSTTFEAKFKRGRLGTKQSCPVLMNGAEPFLMSQFHLQKIFRQISLSKQVEAPLERMGPTLFVGYKRDYFQGMSGIRVTVDRELLFRDLTDDRGGLRNEVHRDSRLILEFKFSVDKKDQVAEIMSGLPFSATRSSKYILGLSHVGKTVYF